MKNNISEDNALVIYYENSLKLRNNLSQPLDLKQRSLKKLIKKQYSDEMITYFKNDLSYVEVEEIIYLLTRYSERTKCKLIILDSARNFIELSKFRIQEIARRGLAIKNKDEMFLNDFEKFNNIVSSELSRPLYLIQSWVSFYQATMKRVANFSVPGSGKTSSVYGVYQ